jgi:hypothetical protein
MQTLKMFMEKHEIVSADFKISPTSGRKVRTKQDVVKDTDDKNGNGVPDTKELKTEESDDKHVIQFKVSKEDGPVHIRKAVVSTSKGADHAIESAMSHYKNHGYKVHDHKYTKEDVDFEDLEENVDKGEKRFLMLARLGLVDKADVSKLRLAFSSLKAEKPLTVQQRTMLLDVFTTLTDLVTGDDTIFNRVKMDVQKEGYVSLAQQRAVWATRKDGGKGHPDNKKKSVKEENSELPFDKPYKKVSNDVKDKSGAVHTPGSRVRHLARLALKKQQQKSK